MMKTKLKIWLGLLLTVALLLGCACALAEETFEVDVPGYIVQGSDLEVKIKPYKGATQYEVAFFNTENWHRTYSQVVKAENVTADATGWFTVTVPADKISSSNFIYTMRIYAEKKYDSEYVESLASNGRYLYVSDSKIIPEEEILISADTISQNQSVAAVAFMSGAKAVMLSIGDEVWTIEGECGYISYWPQETGTYVVNGVAIYGEDEDGGQAGQVPFESKEFTVTEYVGNLGTMTVTFPETISAGQNDVQITATKVNGQSLDGKYVSYTFEVVDLTELQEQVFKADFVALKDEWNPDKTIELMGESQTVTISTEDEKNSIFQAGHTYRLTVFAWCPGYKDVYEYQDYVIPAASGTAIGVDISIEGAEDGTGLTSGNPFVNTTKSEYNVKIQLTGDEAGTYPTIRRVLLANGWGEYEDLNDWEEGNFVERLKESGSESFGRSVDDAQEQVLYVRVGFGAENASDEELNWVNSNVLYVKTEANGGKLNAPTAVVDEEVTRGETFTVSVTNIDEHAEETHAWLESPFTGKRYGNFRMRTVTDENGESNTIAIPTIAVEPGYYNVYVYSSGTGYNPNQTSFLVQVNEPTEELAEVTLQVDSTEVKAGENFTLTAYAPGADWIDIFYDSENNQEWCDTWGGEGFVDQRSYGQSGTYQMKAVAHYFALNKNGEKYQDEKGDWAELDTKASNIVIMKVETDGQIEIVAPEGLPAYIITTDDKVEFTVQKPENADEYSVYVWWDDSNGGLFGPVNTAEEKLEVSIETTGLWKTETWLHVRIEAWGQGYDPNAQQWDIPVIPVAANENVKLEITGLDEDNTILVNKDATLRVTVTEGDIKAVRVFNGDNNWNDEPLDGDGSYTRSISFGEAKTYAVYAKVTSGEWNDEWNGTDTDEREWIYSNVVTVTATADGEVGSLTIAYPDLADVEDKIHKVVTRGETVLVQLSESDQATDYCPNINCNVGEGDQGWDFNKNWDWKNEKEHIARIYTAGMTPGEYWISGFASAPGLLGYDSEWDNQVVYLQVDEPEIPEEGYFSFIVNEVENGNEVSICSGENIIITAYAPGAGWIEVYYDGLERADWSDRFDSAYIAGEEKFPYWTAGEYKLIARAYYPVVDEKGEPVWETNEKEGILTDDEGKNIQKIDWLDSPEYTVRVSAAGDVKIIAPELPDYLKVGEDLSFTVNKPTGADSYDIDVWWDDENGGILGEYNIEESSFDVEVGSGEFPGFETRVHVKIRGKAVGRNEAEQEWIIYLVPAEIGNEKVVLTVEGLDEDGRLPRGASIRVQVSAAEGVEGRIQTISINDGNGYWEHEPLDEDGSYIRDMKFEVAGTYAIYAMVTFDEWQAGYEENDERNWIYTNVEPVTVYVNGTISPVIPAYVDPDETGGNVKSVTRGDAFTVILPPTNNNIEGVEYDFNLQRDTSQDIDGEEVEYDYYWDWEAEDSLAARIYTASLPEGDYKISVTANAIGYNGYDSENEHVLILHVTEPEHESATVDFEVFEASIETGDTVHFTAYAQGADRIEIILDADNHANIINYDKSYASGGITPYWNSGTYTMIARAYFPVPLTDEEGNSKLDENGNPIYEYTVMDSDTHTVTVSASSGNIFIVIPEYLKNMLYLAPDAGLNFKVTADTKLDWMDVNIFVMNDDGSWWNEPIFTGKKEDGGQEVDVTLSAAEFQLQEGQVLIISANGGRTGYNVQGWEVKIPIVNLQDDVEPEVQLSFENVENGTALINQDIHLNISPDTMDGKSIQVVRLFDGNNFQNEIYPDENGNLNLIIKHGVSQAYTIYARVTYDEWLKEYEGRDDDPRNWYTTNVLKLELTDDGTSVGNFEITGVSETVRRGDVIEAVLGNSTDAEDYWLSADGEYELNWNWKDEEKHVARIYTTYLEAGSYSFHAGASAPGKTGYDTEKVTFTVVEPDDGIVFNVDPAGDLYLDDRSYVSVYARGAEHVGFILDGDAWHLDENGNIRPDWEEITDSWFDNNGLKWDEGTGVGEHTLQACALYKDSEGKEKWKYTEVTKVIVKEKGTFKEPTLNVNGAYDATTDMEFSVDGLNQENATGWWVHVEDMDVRDDNGENQELAHWDSDGEIPEQFVVDKSYLFDGHQIRVSASVYADGYISGNAGVEIIVVGKADGTISLSIDKEDGDDFNAWPVNKELIVRVKAPNTSAIRVWNNGDWEWRDSNNMDEDGVYTVNLNYGEPRIYTVVAMASYTPVNWDEVDWDNGFDWDSLNWSATSNQIDVTFRSQGKLKEPTYVLEEQENTVKRGGAFHVTITDNQEKNENYGARLIIPDEEHGEYWESDYYPMDEETKTIIVPTELLEAGDYYQLMIWTSAEGWEGNAAYADVIIQDVAEGEVFISADKTTVMTQESTGWTVYAPGAKQIVVDIYTKDADEKSYMMQGFDTATWETPDFARGENSFGGHAGKAYLEAKVTYEDNTTKTAELEITVTAPYGNLSEAAFRNYNWSWNGGDLSFTVIPDERAEWYAVEVTDSDGNILYQTEPGENGENLERFEKGFDISSDKNVCISVYQAATGYNDVNNEVWINKCDSASMLLLPQALTEIEEEAFEGIGAKAVEIQGGVTAIGARAFQNSSVEVVYVPQSVTFIGENAFPNETTIYGNSDSYVEGYAKTNGLYFVSID